MNAPKTKVLLVVGAILLFVLLFIAPKIVSSEKEQSEKMPATEASNLNIDATIDVYVNQAEKSLDSEAKKSMDKLRLAKNNDSVALFWDKLKRPDIASYYMEEKAKQNNTADSWFKAGNRYYYAVQFCQDQTEVPVLYTSAMRCFTKGLKLEPNDLDAKIMLASCYVEGSGSPMEGVSKLREIEKTDSNNVKLQLTFAFFSLKSNQMDKAIRRFNKVLQIDSTYIEAYLHLADAYERQGETDKTIAVLEKYAAKTEDVTARVEINKYIQQLKK